MDLYDLERMKSKYIRLRMKINSMTSDLSKLCNSFETVDDLFVNYTIDGVKFVNKDVDKISKEIDAINNKFKSQIINAINSQIASINRAIDALSAEE